MLSLLWNDLGDGIFINTDQKYKNKLAKTFYSPALWIYFILYTEATTMSKRLYITNWKQVSEAKNACLSLSSSDEEGEDGGDPDLHQCGHCKLMFNNLTKYITHKIQKECWIDRNPVEEELAWSPERNEMSSPDGSNKDEIEEEHADQQPDIEVKNLHHDLQKRKLRKGYVRRIKPTEILSEGGNTSLGEVFDGEGAEMVLVPEHEERGKDDLQTSFVDKKGQEKVEFSKNDFVPNETNSDVGSKCRGHYNYTSSGRKPYMLYTRSDEHTKKDGSKRLSEQSKSKHPYNDLMEQTRNVRPYGFPNPNNNNKYDRIPSNLPQIMSTRGSPLHDNYGGRKYPRDKPYGGEKQYPGERPYPSNRQSPGDRPYPGDRFYSGDRPYTSDRSYSSDRPYPGERSYPSDRPYPGDQPYAGDRQYTGDRPYHNNYDRYIEDYPQSKYYPSQEADTASTWTSNYIDRPNTSQSKPNSTHMKNSEHNKYNENIPYDGYRTMANLKNDDHNDKQLPPGTESENKDVQHDTNTENNETENLEKIVEDETEKPTPPVAAPLSEPPQLVRVQNIESDKLDFNKPPPALEKCCPDKTEEKNIKLPDVQNQDSLTSAPEIQTPEITNLNESQDTETSPGGSRLMDLSSPEKESNSPQDSNHSHETEDYNLEHPRETSDIQLPPHRRLSESTVERLITVPASVGSDASWKHAKQVYSCPLCAKVFPFKSKLQRHVLVHTGIKPYKCTVCGRGFTQQIDLQRHLTRHTGEKPFKCHLCTAQFIRADNLRKHCKDSHYVNIEEPIRKRRRKTTGSDTVLPSLEVAIALAFSETERNGGRVLGRAVTRTNPRNPTVPQRSTAHSEDGGQGNYNYPGSRLDLPPFRGGYPSDMFPARQNIRYAFPGKMDNQYPGKMENRFPGKIEGQFPGKREGQFSQEIDTTQPYMGRRRDYVPGEPPRYYQNAPQSGGNMPRPEYDRESQDYYQMREGEGKQSEPRKPPDQRSSNHRYPPGYRSMPGEPRAQDYVPRRSDDEEFNRPPNEVDYQSRRGGSDGSNVPRKYEHTDEYAEGHDSRGPPEDSGRYGESSRYTGFGSQRGEKEREEVAGRGERDEQGDARSSYMQRPPPRINVPQSTSITPYVQSEVDKEDHRAAFRDKPSFNYGDYGPLVPSRSPDVNRGQVNTRGKVDTRNPIDSRTQYEYEGNYGFNKNTPGSDTTADPGEYISMATEKENDPEPSVSPDEDIKPNPNEEVEYVKSNEITPSQTNVYVDEEEIPIVTRSDDLAVISEET